MITTRNFNEAFKQYKSSVIPYRLVQEQAIVMLGICSNSYSQIDSALAITEEVINWLMQQAESSFNYSDYLGGNVYICEIEADLQQIQGCDFEWAELHGGWPKVTDKAMSWDNCSYLQESIGEPQWVIFLLCWNNAGGPVYYVPKQLWTVARVTEHIAATENAWKS